MHDMLRDPEQLRELLLPTLLRAMFPAIRKLKHSACGRDAFGSDDQFRSCVALVRLLPRLIGPMPEQVKDPFDDPMWWTPHKLGLWERLGGLETRQESAEAYAAAFHKNGPVEGLYQTHLEALEYGRERWDQRNESGLLKEQLR